MKKMHYNLFDGWEVSFDRTWSNFDDPGLGDYITFCVIRKPHTKYIFSGCAVLHPNELIDDNKGYKVAFGRALEAMLPYAVCETEYDKWMYKRLRQKFWGALLPQL